MTVHLLLIMAATTDLAHSFLQPRSQNTLRSSILSEGRGQDNYLTKENALRKQKSLSSLVEFTDRRKVLSHITLATGFMGSSARAGDLQTSILQIRMDENISSPPSYGMQSTDIVYPAYFQGSWKACSKTSSVYAPCGFELFPGGKRAYDNAIQREVNGGDSLEYKARFVTQPDGGDNDSYYIAADREYNAKEIAKAAMGSYSVVDVSVATPNRFSCVLAPPEGSGASLIAVDILAIARKYEPTSATKYCCSEVVRQIVSEVKGSNPNTMPNNPLSIKEIETISIYDVDKSDDSGIREIRCKQRTATFLVPSQTDPMAFKMWQLSRGQSVDVRYYDVIYTRS